MKDVLYLIVFLGIIIVPLLIIVGLFSSIGEHNRVTDYDLYGEGGADEWERKQMGMSIEEYGEYIKKYSNT